MNIGFDFDKIFIDYPPFVPSSIIDRLYKESSDGVLAYRIPSKPEQFFRLITHLSPFRPPIIANIEFVRNMSRKNKHRYYIISSRFSFLRDRTHAIVKKYDFNSIFDGMFFNFENKQPHIFKDEVIKKLQLDYYVDDDLPLLKFLAKRNHGILFYWLNDKMVKSLDSNLFAISDLSDIIKR